MTSRRPRGPDPISRWLGDDRPRRRVDRPYAASAAFLVELGEVLSPTGEFEYDGRYASLASDANLEFVVYPYGESWEYGESCGCTWCAAHRRLHEPAATAYADEWDRARAEYEPTRRPPREPPRLRPYAEADARLAEAHSLTADGLPTVASLRRTVRMFARDDDWTDERRVERAWRYVAATYLVRDADEPRDCDCTRCEPPPLGLLSTNRLTAPSGPCARAAWHERRRELSRRLLEALRLPPNWSDERNRRLADVVASVGRASLQLTTSFQLVGDEARRVAELFAGLPGDATATVDVESLDRWVDDGGRVGTVDY